MYVTFGKAARRFKLNIYIHLQPTRYETVLVNIGAWDVRAAHQASSSPSLAPSLPPFLPFIPAAVRAAALRQSSFASHL